MLLILVLPDDVSSARYTFYKAVIPELEKFFPLAVSQLHVTYIAVLISILQCLCVQRKIIS